MSRGRRLAAAAFLAAVGLLFVFIVFGPRSTSWESMDVASRVSPSTTPAVAPAASPLQSPLPEPDLAGSEVLARVGDHTITRSYLSKMVRLSRVLGTLSGGPVLGEREILDVLVRSQLILDAVSPEREPTDDEIASRIRSLVEDWGVSDDTLYANLDAEGLEYRLLSEAIRRSLMVDAALERLEGQGYTVSEWLSEQEQAADIWVVENLLVGDSAASSLTAQADAPTKTPAARPPVPDVAPAFTLDRAGGGSFTLEHSLADGPVVLLFFERCGWGPDRTQLVQLREEYEAFRRAGAEVVAVAVAPVSTIDRGVRQALNPPYPLLADPDHRVAEAFGVYELVSSGYAAPSVFVIDADRSIVYSYVGEDRYDRPSIAEILANLP